MIGKQTDQMYYLLQICLTLHPQSIDESVTRSMNEKLSSGDRMQKLQRGGTGGQNAEEDFLQEMEQLYLFACPKFISPVLPNLSEKKDNHKDDCEENAHDQKKSKQDHRENKHDRAEK